MMYPFMTLDDETEIVHSEVLDDGQIKVYFEKPTEDGFQNATCFLPSYTWEEVNGFSETDVSRFNDILRSTAHLIYRFAEQGGILNAAAV